MLWILLGVIIWFIIGAGSYIFIHYKDKNEDEFTMTDLKDTIKCGFWGLIILIVILFSWLEPDEEDGKIIFWRWRKK